MSPRAWFRPVGYAFLIGGALTALSCGGGGGPSFVVPACALDFVSPNYAAAVDPSTGSTNKMRWWRGFPVKVWFDTPLSFNTSQGIVSTTDIITTAINRWPTATTNGVRYVFVSSESEAHIKIRVDFLPNEPLAIGETNATVNVVTGEVVAADILINTWNGMSEAQLLIGMKATAAHEMGHALYLGGHSGTTTDLMYWQNDSSLDKAISAMDMNTIQTAYCGNFQTRGRGVGDGLPGDGPFVIETTICPADHS